MIDSGRGAARAEDAQGTPTHSHISPSILVYEDQRQDLAARQAAVREVREDLQTCNMRRKRYILFIYYYIYIYKCINIYIYIYIYRERERERERDR